MKYSIILVTLLLYSHLSAQTRLKIYYDNQDNTVVRFFSHQLVPLMLAENPMEGISTVYFSVSKEGKVISINNLLGKDDLFYETAKDAIERSSGAWNIKPGLNEQSFQITFYITSEKLDSLKHSVPSKTTEKLEASRYIKYNGIPNDIVLLPRINIIYRDRVRPTRIIEN